MGLLPADFKSAASADFAIRASDTCPSDIMVTEIARTIHLQTMIPPGLRPQSAASAHTNLTAASTTALPLKGAYCAVRKQMSSPSSRYSAEQASPPQIMVSPPQS